MDAASSPWLPARRALLPELRYKSCKCWPVFPGCQAMSWLSVCQGRQPPSRQAGRARAPSGWQKTPRLSNGRGGDFDIATFGCQMPTLSTELRPKGLVEPKQLRHCLGIGFNFAKSAMTTIVHAE